MRLCGTVDFFNIEKGYYGFIKQASGEDIFVYCAAIIGGDKLARNDHVEYEVAYDKGIGKRQAVCGRLTDPSMKASFDPAPEPQESKVNTIEMDDMWQMEVLDESEDEAFEASDQSSELEQEDEAEEATVSPENRKMVSLSEVFLTHNAISCRFRTGRLFDEVIEDICSSEMAFDDFPPIVCTRWSQKWSSKTGACS